MSRLCLALLLLSTAVRARADDEKEKQEWIRRQDEQQFNGGEGGNRLLSTRPSKLTNAVPEKKAPVENGPLKRAPVNAVGGEANAVPGGSPQEPASGPTDSGGASAGVGSGAAPADTSAPPQSGAQAKAAAKAGSMAKALTQGLSGAAGEAGPGGAAGSASARQDAGAAAHTGASAPDPSRPLTSAELVMAAGPYNASFKATGVKVGLGVDGRPAVVDAGTGKPASAEQLRALRENIAAEPRALMRRPDFYRVIARDDYQALKGVYVASEGRNDARFKHMALTEPPRDFVWKESCREVSGQCNEHAREKSYAKGQDVAPETLAAVMKDVQESSESGDSLWADYVRYQKEMEERERAESGRGSRLGRRSGLSSLLEKLAGGFGWDDKGGADGLPGARAAGAGVGGPAADIPGAHAFGGASALASGGAQPSAALGSRPGAAAAGRRGWAVSAGALFLAALILLRRRKEER